MVNTRTDAELAAAVQAAVDAMLPQIREQVREEYRTGAVASGSNPPPVTIHTWLERFNKQKPRSFEKAVAPTRLAVYKFEGDALAWWKAYKQAKGGDAWVLTLTWAAFKELFFLQFFPRAEQERLKREYHSIRQRASENSTEYMQRFLRLAGFLGQAAGTAEEQAKNFRWGLHKSILDHVMCIQFTDVAQVADAARNLEILRDRDDYDRSERSQQSRVPSEGYTHPVCNTCGRRHLGECRRAAGTCFKCGQAGHLQRDCKKNTGASSSGHADKKPDASGRVFALTQDQAANTSGTITGALFIFGRAVFVLFDTGATHSVISTKFASCFTMTPILLDHVLCISTPMKDSARITHVYRDLPLQFDDKIRSVNALPLDMCEFDIILGIDWKCRAPICWDQVGERILEGPEMIEVTNEKVVVAREKLKKAQTRQKSYADRHRRALEFPPTILDRLRFLIALVRFPIVLALPPQLSHVHNVFHVSLLRGYKYHPLHVVSYPFDQIREDLSYTEEPESILDHQDRVMRNKTIPFVKILWRNHPEREATWETEESIRTSYPLIFLFHDLFDLFVSEEVKEIAGGMKHQKQSNGDVWD
ncbi:putative reverse transcriptase domain-containing protein [Tanacetum coccineum]